MDQRLRRLKDKANKLPLTPGVYIMRDASHEIIYIGKAKKLKNRVSQYFGAQEKHLPKVQKMVEHVADFDYILTDSEFEALVLEASLIKQNQPHYNILLKDNKGFSYIKVTRGAWRNIYHVLQKDDSDADFIGPYTAGYTVTRAVDEAKRIYKLPTCTKVFPRDIGKSRPCLNFHLGLCSAPCAKKISQADYDRSVEDALRFLKKGSEDTLSALREEMEAASEKLDFERAAQLRDTIRSIERVGSRQKVVQSPYREQDVFGLSVTDGRGCLSVMRFADHKLYDSETFFLEETEQPETLRSSLLMSYYGASRKVPPRIEVDGEVEDREILERYLSEKRGSGVTVAVPQRGDQARLVDLCRSNASQKLIERYASHDRSGDALAELSVMLGLAKVPAYIESYDISHTGGSDNVAGMVVFENGKPLKSAYRRFSVKGFDGQDDTRSMAEVVSRRFDEYEKCRAQGITDGFGRLPDLILLDGGSGQVNAVLPVLAAHGVNVPLFGMVKDGRHRTAAISTGGGRIEFNARRKAFAFVTALQDEVHRFAISYHRRKHAKTAFADELERIPGVGPKKAQALLKQFKTISAVAAASEEELAAVPGISARDANAIRKAFSLVEGAES